MARQRRHAHAQGPFRGALPRLQHCAIHLENPHPPVEAGAILGMIRARNVAVSSKPRAGSPTRRYTSREAIEIRPASGVGASAFALAVELDGRTRRTRQPNPTFLKMDLAVLEVRPAVLESSTPPYSTADPAVPEARSRRT
ncbi:hypothetical protein BD626DRAFT_507701 [Schizophyllum amplum]|uniref:Uncharacterized protein n=1 Tax=Schizophyllum amplum TaxID=97359 RepID=A0A550C481_9AGAR|nr:hypothetical protein BD626DRAFT_507701 [Auriculariopsis ampla]